jgi:hypothetical protein
VGWDLGLVDGVPQVGVLAHAVAVAANRDEMAVVHESIDQRGRHDVIAEDLTPLFKAFVCGQHGRCVLVAASTAERTAWRRSD